MGAVGGFPSMRDLNRRTIRGPVNPLDISTIFSIYPRPIRFKNVTLSPGRWYLEAGSPEKPSSLQLGPSSWFRDVSLDEPLIEITQSSVQIAESLVKDYIGGMFAVNMANCMPGIFFVPGKFTLNKLKQEYPTLLGDAITFQFNYYRLLVKYADALWARSNGNPLAIQDEMRMAARALGMQDKDWMKDHAAVGMVPCFACGEFKHPDYAICKTCHSIDPSHPKAAMIQRVQPNTDLSPFADVKLTNSQPQQTTPPAEK